MTLPLPTLFGLQMPALQKFAVAGIFLLVWVTIAFDILRLVESLRSGATLTSLYTSLETEVAVIVSSLPTYRVAFTKSDKMKKAKNIMLGKIGVSRRSKGSSRAQALQSDTGESGGSHSKAGSEDWIITATEAPAVPSQYALRSQDV